MATKVEVMAETVQRFMAGMYLDPRRCFVPTHMIVSPAGAEALAKKRKRKRSKR
jgi:hypothetical protein